MLLIVIWLLKDIAQNTMLPEKLSNVMIRLNATVHSQNVTSPTIPPRLTNVLSETISIKFINRLHYNYYPYNNNDRFCTVTWLTLIISEVLKISTSKYYIGIIWKYSKIFQSRTVMSLFISNKIQRQWLFKQKKVQQPANRTKPKSIILFIDIILIVFPSANTHNAGKAKCNVLMILNHKV